MCICVLVEDKDSKSQHSDTHRSIQLSSPVHGHKEPAANAQQSHHTPLHRRDLQKTFMEETNHTHNETCWSDGETLPPDPHRHSDITVLYVEEDELDSQELISQKAEEFSLYEILAVHLHIWTFHRWYMSTIWQYFSWRLTCAFIGFGKVTQCKLILL